MGIFDSLSSIASGYIIEKTGKFVSGVIDKSKDVVVENVALGGIPPEVIVTSVSPWDLATGDSYVDSNPRHYLDAEAANGWGGELRLRFWLRNPTKHMIEVVGIDPRK